MSISLLKDHILNLYPTFEFSDERFIENFKQPTFELGYFYVLLCNCYKVQVDMRA